ncbi:hypothetical protein AZE42_03548 [Rhizopogon vesiculosus]|uniref:Uncharacterized protein n=1 Tax=Rhizopogon vesiculosus TaxID=180088 RepID=A0A1J8PRL4_9AGAM|nr:hypothetical protein AZE42_03548 [Rhizopogon vesiculosus]
MLVCRRTRDVTDSEQVAQSYVSASHTAIAGAPTRATLQ